MLPSPKNLLTSYMPRRPESGSDTGGGWFDLDDWIGPQHPSGRSDVAKIEGILANSGDYSLERTQGPTGYWGLALDDGIRKYQKRNGLKIDGTLRPGGPTIEHMRANFSALLDGHTPPTPDDIDAHHEVVNDDNPGTIAWQDPPATFANVANLPEVDQETDASNARLARGMAKSGDFRSYAQLFARTIQDSGLSGVAAVNDAIQKFDAIHPGKGGLLASAVQSEVPEETLKAFGLARPEAPPKGTVQVAGPFQEALKIIARPQAPPPIPFPPLPGYTPAEPDKQSPPAEKPQMPNHTGNQEPPKPEQSNPEKDTPPAAVEQGTTLVNEIVDGILPSIFEITYGDGKKDNRGGDDTLTANGEIAKYIKKKFSDSQISEVIKHVGGASLNGEGQTYLKETIVDIFGKKVRRADLTHELTGPDGAKSHLHTNTVTTKADGTPTQREQGAADDIASVARKDRTLIVPKPNQGEPAMAYIDRVRPVIDELLDPIIEEYVRQFRR